MFKTKLFRIILVPIGLATLVLAAAQFGAFTGVAPSAIGSMNGRLAPPALTPNSVSSQALLYPDHPQKQYANIDPISYQGDPFVAMVRLREVLEKFEHTKVIKSEPGYIYAQCTTPFMQFTDDVEFLLDQQNHVIQVRSASRLGKSDFGINRARVEIIRTRYKNVIDDLTAS